MPRTSLASVQLDVSEEPQELPRPDPDMPFRILVAGNFSGGASRIRKPVAVDRDNFDEVLALFGPELKLEFAKTPLNIQFREMDDFHPDRLFERLAPFHSLRSLREQLEDGGMMPSAAAQPDLSGAGLLSMMMGDEPGAAPAPSNRSTWDQMLHEIVAPYAEPKPDPRKPQWIRQTDAAITGEMRGLLHQGAFQELEAAWRGLFFLTRRLETSESLKIYIWDMPLDELITVEGLAALRKVLVEETVGIAGGTPWAVLAGLYSFGPEHVGPLTQIAAIARSAGAPLLAGVQQDVVGLPPAFDTLRHSSDARWVGLAMPRFLLRLPYGEKTDATERFSFEEMPESPEHQRYLWGNPAIACAYLLGEAFTRYGWEMRPGQVSDIDGLPLHVYKDDGEAALKPCAEVLLTEEAVEVLLESGLMPIISLKGRDCVRLARFQSIAQPAAPLAGRWS
jgi:type VI secretion system protein ImpC